MTDRNDPIRVLFVCMGNICRSPLAEGVLRQKVRERGVEGGFHIDSAGTGGWHVGEAPDRRMRAVAAGYGVQLESSARQIRREDFDRFDHILCMDADNHAHVLGMNAPPGKVRLLLEYDTSTEHAEVPDPYYGGEDGFDLVFRLVDAACEAFLDEVGADRVDGSADAGSS